MIRADALTLPASVAALPCSPYANASVVEPGWFLINHPLPIIEKGTLQAPFSMIWRRRWDDSG